MQACTHYFRDIEIPPRDGERYSQFIQISDPWRPREFRCGAFLLKCRDLFPFLAAVVSKSRLGPSTEQDLKGEPLGSGIPGRLFYFDYKPTDRAPKGTSAATARLGVRLRPICFMFLQLSVNVGFKVV